MSLRTSTRTNTRSLVANEIKTESLTTSGYTTTTKNVGVANTGVVATEYGDAHIHRTVLTINVANAAGLVTTDNAALASGYKLYTFPAGNVLIDAAYMSVALTSVEHSAETPDVGLGTVIGSGAVADLSGTATFENIITGQTANDMNGTAEVKASLPTTIGYPLLVSSDDVFFNMAATWANTAGADNTVDISGTVVLLWRFLA
jgi:hypothetical protein